MKPILLLSLSLPTSYAIEPDLPPSQPATTIDHAISGSAPSSPTFKISPATRRARHRLLGLTSQWSEPGEEMSFVVRFIRDRDSAVEHVFFPVSETSPEWNGQFETLKYLKRREIIPIPRGTNLVQIAFTSSGPPQAVGVYSIRDLKLSEVEGPLTKVLLENGTTSNGLKFQWKKSGTHPFMAMEGADFPAQLHIIDNVTTGHADWAARALPVTGEQIIVEWSEAYSIGLGGPRTIRYDRLPPGDYRFQVEELTIEGLPTGQVTSIDFKVPRPLWQTWWFWLLCLAAVAFLIFVLIRSAVKRKIQRAIRHTRLIENERLRIAMDLHDDIGTRLSQISLIGSHARMNAPDQKTKDSLQQISNLTGNLSGSLSETVWMLSPKNNDLESLIGFLSRIASELCRAGEIRCRIDADPVDEEIKISQEFRHHFVLSVKEALNNALKHSGAREIRLTIKLEEGILTVTVSDDGSGFDLSMKQSGNGLNSLRKRMHDLKGSIAFSKPRRGGTTISMKAPLKQTGY